MKKLITLFLIFGFIAVSAQQLSNIRITEAQIASDSLIPGSSVNTSCKALNVGGSPSGLFDMDFFLSSDTLFSSGDIWLGTVSNIQIVNNVDSTIEKTIIIPETAYSNKWYVLFVANRNFAIQESIYSDNLAHQALFVKEMPLSDLTISDFFTKVDTATIGSLVEIEFLISNNGIAESNSCVAGIYISQDTIFDSYDILAKEFYVPNIKQGNLFSNPITFNIPFVRLFGESYILLQIDNKLSVFERDENNNFASTKIYIEESPSADLIITDPAFAPLNIIAGNTGGFSALIKNIGLLDAGYHKLGFYLSKDNNLDAQDLKIGNSLLINPIEKQNQLVISGNINIPIASETGVWNIIFYIDAEQNIAESNELNNTNSISISVTEVPLPDLLVTEATVPIDSIMAGTQFTANYQVNNIGQAQANANQLKVFLSNDTIFDVNDISIISSAVPQLQAVIGVDNKEITPTLPESTQKGTKFLLFYVDANNSNTERNELNNIRWKPINVKLPPLPDFIITQNNLSNNSIIAGNTINLSTAVKNIGNKAANSSALGWYLSKDTVLNIYDVEELEADIFLGQMTITNLAIDESSSVNHTVPIPIVNEFGLWYLLHVADFNQNIIEKNEKNNIAFNSLYIEKPPLPDLTIVDPIVSSDTIVAGENTQFFGTLKNIGQGKAPESIVQFYLSKNTFIDTNDVILASISMGELTEVIGTFSLSEFIDIPYETAMGTYYLLIVADGNETIIEEREDNNLVFVKIHITQPPLPDLIVYLANIQETEIQATKNLEFSYAIKNIGEIPANNSQLYCVLSRDPIPNNDEYEIYLGSFDVTTLNKDQIFTQNSVSLKIALETGLGRWYLLLLADGNNSIVEANELNNTKALEIYILPPPLPDLKIKDLSTTPKTIKAGTQQNINYTITNKGDALSAANYTSIYLSKDTILDTGYGSTDIFLINLYQKSLQEVIGIDSHEESIYFPYEIKKGNYYLLAKTDGEETIYESNEYNNITYLAIQIIPADLPDLVIENQAIFPAEVVAGKNVGMSFTVKNKGIIKSGVSYAGIYLTVDTINSNNFYYLASTFIDSLNINQGISDNKELTIPGSWPTGKSYLCFIADLYDDVFESNELNNIKFVELNVLEAPKPDLIVSIETVSPDTIVAGKSTSISAIVKNIGNANSNSSELYYFISKDAIFNSEDFMLFQWSEFAGLPSEIGITAINAKVPIPEYIAKGTYYLFFYVDYDNYNIESNENNNTAFRKIVILDPPLPDLTIADLAVVPNPITAGNYLKYSFMVKNLGDTIANQVFTNLYLSTDTTLSNDDKYLDYQYSTSIMLNKVSNDSITIPYNTIAANYYVIAVTDPDSSIRESKEWNNKAHTPIEIKDPPRPDLLVKSLNIAPNQIDFNTNAANFFSNIHIENKGFANASNVYIGVYLSTNPLLDDQDVFVDQIYVGTIPSINESYLTQNIHLTERLIDGVYYLIYKIDYDNLIIESDETNNTLSQEIKIDYRLPDLVPYKHDLLPSAIYQGTTALIGNRLMNNNLGNSNFSYLNYYLSTDNKLDGNDKLLNESGFDILTMGKYIDLKANVHIPSNTAEGEYFLLLYADGNQNIDEINESNNIIYEPLKVLKPMFPDLFISNLSFSNLSVILDVEIPFTYKFGNAGNTNSGEASITYLLSKDAYLDPSDEVIGIKTIDTIEINTSFEVKDTLILSPFITPGYYYLIVAIDNEDHIYEIYENNNSSYVELRIDEDYYPDLTFNNATLLTHVINPGSNVELNVMLQNLGTVAANDIQVKFFLSDNWNEPQLLNEIYIDELRGNSEKEQTYLINISVMQAVGYYTLYAIIDPEEQILEFDEANNLIDFPITISNSQLPDITTSEVAIINEYFQQGGNIQFNHLLRNTSGYASQSFKIAYFLSNNYFAYDFESMILLDTTQYDSLGTFETKEIEMSLTLPDNLNNGVYYLVIISDVFDSIEELDEQNNVSFASFTIDNSPLAELSIADFQLSNYDLNRVSEVLATSILKNQGNIAATNVKVSYVLSSDSYFDSYDFIIDDFIINSINANESRKLEHLLSLDLFDIEGYAYLIIVVDPTNSVPEINETNNSAKVNVTYTLVGEVLNNSYSINPNPAKDWVTIVFDHSIKNGDLKIFDLKGNLIRVFENVNAQKFTFSVIDLQSGVYLIQVIGNDNPSFSKLIIE